MLFWSESDSEFVVDPELPKRLAYEISDEDYERKIVGLLSRSFKADVERAREAEAQWQQAAGTLHQGDHYILVMLEEAVPMNRSFQAGVHLRDSPKFELRNSNCWEHAMQMEVIE